jgi:hypothetical protein
MFCQDIWILHETNSAQSDLVTDKQTSILFNHIKWEYNVSMSVLLRSLKRTVTLRFNKILYVFCIR